MVDFYLSRMVQSMIDANGGVGTFADFEGMVLNGFPQPTLDAAGITQADVQTKLNVYMNFKRNPSNVANINSHCP